MRFQSVSDLKKPSWRVARERSVLRMTGADRLRWLNGLVTSNVESPSPEHYGLLCEKKGKIEADFYQVTTKDAVYLAVPANRLDAVYTILEHHLIMEDVELTKEPSLVATWLYASASSPDLAPLPPLATNVRLRGIGGESALAAVLTIHDSSNGSGASDAHGSPGAADGPELTDEEWRALRVFSGIAEMNADFDNTLYPQEATLEDWAVAFDKGCYMGQEVIFMMQNRGHARRRLVLLEGRGLTTGAELHDAEGKVVGDVRSVATVGSETRAIALVKASSMQITTKLRAGDPNANIVGTVIAAPPVPAAKA